MKNIIVFIILSIVFAGCIFSEDEKESESGVLDYLPDSLVGSSFTWRSTKSNPETDSTIVSTYTLTTTGTVNYSNKTYYTGTISGEGKYPQFSVEDNGIYFLVDDTVFGLHEGGYPYGKPPVEDYCFFDFSLNRNVKQIVMDWGSQTDSLYINYVITSMYLGQGTVSVPAGVFEDCKQFKLELSLTYTPKISGDTIRLSRTEMHWFGENTGVVRREIMSYYNGTFYDNIVEELISTSFQ